MEWRNKPEIRKCFFTTVLLTRSGQEAWYDNSLKRSDKKLFVIETKDAIPIGTIGLDHIDLKNRKAELGNMLIGDLSYWGQGLGSDASLTLLKFAFDKLKLNRVYLQVYTWNKNAIRAYEKCNFKVEGILRQNIHSQGKFQDVVLMSVLLEDFESMIT